MFWLLLFILIIFSVSLSNAFQVKDKPALNLSRSSVPNGLLIMETQTGSCVVTSQKFAKGTRFGPLLAQKSYVPIKNIPFPLVLFAGPYLQQQPQQDEYSSDLQALFSSSRNIYLDTRNESKCNWMIHVNLARFSNEQNLICYQVRQNTHTYAPVCPSVNSRARATITNSEGELVEALSQNL